MPATAPSLIIPAFKKVKDPLSNLQTSCEFTARLQFAPSKLRIKASVDGEAFAACTYDILSNFPPMIRINGITIPRDAYSHPVAFQMWHEDAVNGDSDIVTTDPIVAVFDEVPPPVPTNVVVTVLRDRVGVVPDKVHVAWASAYDVEIICLDDQGKKRVVGSGAEADSELIIENCSRFGTQDGIAHSYRIGVQAVNRSTASAIVYADPINLMTTNDSLPVLSPDDLAGTAQYLTHSAFMAWLTAQFAGTDASVVNNVFVSALNKIKDVVAKGGSVTLADVGVFKAVWTPERTSYKNGQYITIPPARNPAFNLSLGFQKGVKAGEVMSDTEAALS